MADDVEVESAVVPGPAADLAVSLAFEVAQISAVMQILASYAYRQGHQAGQKAAIDVWKRAQKGKKPRLDATYPNHYHPDFTDG